MRARPDPRGSTGLVVTHPPPRRCPDAGSELRSVPHPSRVRATLKSMGLVRSARTASPACRRRSIALALPHCPASRSPGGHCPDREAPAPFSCPPQPCACSVGALGAPGQHIISHRNHTTALAVGMACSAVGTARKAGIRTSSLPCGMRGFPRLGPIHSGGIRRPDRPLLDGALPLGAVFRSFAVRHHG